MECLKFNRFFNNLLGVPGILQAEQESDKRKISFYSFYQRLSEVFVFASVILQFMAVPSIWVDMNILCGCLASGTHSLQVLLKTCFFNTYKHDIIRYLKHMEDVQKRGEEFEHKYLGEDYRFVEYYLIRSRYIRLMLTSIFAITFVSTSAYFLPFVYNSIISYDTVDSQLTPIVVQIFINIQWTPAFQVMIIYLTISFYFINLKTVVMDNFMLGMIVLCTSHFWYQKKLLKRALEKYFPDEAESYDGLNIDESTVLRKWIMAHQKLLKATSLFRNVISPYLLLEFSYILVHTCVPAFVITSTFSWTVAQKMAVLFIVSGGLVQLLLMAIAGDAFNQAWELVDADLFRSTLNQREEKWNFNFFMMNKARLKFPYHFSAYNLFPLGCSTFATILRLIVSHYMTLNQIQSMKSEKN